MHYFVLCYVAVCLLTNLAYSLPQKTSAILQSRQSVDNYPKDVENNLISSQERFIPADVPCTSDASIDILALIDDGYDDFDLDNTQEGSLSRRRTTCPVHHGKVAPTQPSIAKPPTQEPAKIPEPPGQNRNTPSEFDHPCKKYEDKPYLLTCAGPEVVKTARSSRIIYVGFCNEGKSSIRRDHQIRHQTNTKQVLGRIESIPRIQRSEP